jgi:hypothetical protein
MVPWKATYVAMPAPVRSDSTSRRLPTSTADMSNEISEKPVSSAIEFEAQRHGSGYDTGEKAGYDKSGAIDAENIEHDMTVMQAVKAYPAASWWAFVMSSTIVSSGLNHNESSSDATIRLWNHTASS